MTIWGGRRRRAGYSRGGCKDNKSCCKSRIPRVRIKRVRSIGVGYGGRADWIRGFGYHVQTPRDWARSWGFAEGVGHLVERFWGVFSQIESENFLKLFTIIRGVDGGWGGSAGPWNERASSGG